MAKKGCNKVRIRTGDVPNIDDATSSNSYKTTIKGQTAALDIVISCLESGHNCSRVRVLHCGNCPIA